MPELSYWRESLVIQRRPNSGCIPTGYEWMIRAAHIPDVNLDAFQDDFDFDTAGGEPRNNFDSIAEAVEGAYPHVKIQRRRFEKGRGAEKIEFIKTLIQHDIPCLISVTLYPQGGWHIMPVIYIDDMSMRLINGVEPDGRIDARDISLSEAIRRHDFWPGGDDIAWIETTSKSEPAA